MLDRIVTKDETVRSEAIKSFSVTASTSLRIDDSRRLVSQFPMLFPQDGVCLHRVILMMRKGHGKAVYTISKSTNPLDKRTPARVGQPADNGAQPVNECLLIEDFRHTTLYVDVGGKSGSCPSLASSAVPLHYNNELGSCCFQRRAGATLMTSCSFLAFGRGFNAQKLADGRESLLRARTDELTGLLNRGISSKRFGSTAKTPARH